MIFDVEGIVFDLDGTLTDSIDCYYRIFREATLPFGLQVTREDVLGPMATGENVWQRAIPADLPDRDGTLREIRKLIPGLFQKVMAEAVTFPAVGGLVRELDARGIALGIVTASWRPALQPLERDDLLPYFRSVVSYEDGLAAKPAPDGILACLRQLGVAPSRALTVGDAPADIRAGRAAGTTTVAVLSGVATREQLEAAEPDVLFPSVAELLSVLPLPGAAERDTFDYGREDP